MNRLRRRWRELVTDNPLLLYQYERGNFYASIYPYLIIVFLVYTIIAFARFEMWVEVQKYINILPEALQPADREFFQCHSSRVSAWPVPSFTDLGLFVLQMVLLFVAFAFTLISTAFDGIKVRFGGILVKSIYSSDMRVLPVSSDQVLFAARCIHSIACSVVFWIMLLMLYVPSRNPSPLIDYQIQRFLEEYDLSWRTLIVLVAVLVWLLVQVGFRSLEILISVPKTPEAHLLARTWIYAFFTGFSVLTMDVVLNLGNRGVFLESAFWELFLIFYAGILVILIQTLRASRVLHRAFDDDELAEAAVRRAVGA